MSTVFHSFIILSKSIFHRVSLLLVSMGLLQSLFIVFAPVLLLCHSVYASALPESNSLERRDAVDSCQAILVSITATAFCSSLNHISDMTKTVTSAASGTQAVVTATGAPCTTTKPATTVTITQSVAGPTAVTIITVTLPAETSTVSSALAASTVSSGLTKTVTASTTVTTTGAPVTQTASIHTTASVSSKAPTPSLVLNPKS